MDQFIHHANIERFRQLLARTTNDADRERILKLLAEEEAKDHLPSKEE